MTLVTFLIPVILMQSPIAHQLIKHSRDSVKPKDVQMRDLPATQDTSMQELRIIHAPLPEHPDDTLKKHQKLPVYKPKIKPIKLNPLKGKKN